MQIRKLSIMICIALLSSGTAFAKAQSRKMKDIQKLTRLMGADQMAKQMVDQLLSALKKNHPNVPAAKWKRIRAKANTTNLLNDIAKVYDRNLSHGDIRELIAFFESPVGKKFMSLQPKLMRESMEIGNRWGQRITQEIQKQLGDG